MKTISQNQFRILLAICVITAVATPGLTLRLDPLLLPQAVMAHKKAQIGERPNCGQS